MNERDREELLHRVRSWFGETEQVEHYVDGVRQGPTATERTALDDLPPGSHVLDVGCGAGRIALYLGQRGHPVVGVDIGIDLVSAAKHLAQQDRLKASFAIVDPLSVPFSDNAFDAVVAIKLYGYVPGREQRLKYLAEINRVLRPGGRLVLTNHVVPSEHDALEALRHESDHAANADQFSSLEALDTFPGSRGYVHWFTQESLIDELTESDLRVETICPAGRDFQVTATLVAR